MQRPVCCGDKFEFSTDSEVRLSLNPSSAAYWIYTLGQVTQALCASVITFVKWK